MRVSIRPKNKMNGNHFSDVFDKFHIDLILETNENSSFLVSVGFGVSFEFFTRFTSEYRTGK